MYNAHPGIIPTSRGLDSFKWALYSGDQLGITIHEISNQVDKGDIVNLIKTPVYKSDNITRLAKRHYKLEISELSKIIDIYKKRIKSTFKNKKSNDENVKYFRKKNVK